MSNHKELIVRLVKSNRWRMALALVYLISTAVLVTKMASPVNIRIVFQGEREIYEKEVLNVYTFTDMLVAVVAAIAMSSSVLILALRSNMSSKIRPRNADFVFKTLSENKKEIYKLILDKDGFAFQSELVETSKISKSTVSIILNRLEANGLIEKRKSGMSNIIIAKSIEPIKE
ncbi:MAG: helix-turn-helix transcriptional regulator [Thermoproteota archaeon]